MDNLNKRTVVRRIRQGNTSPAPVATGGQVQPASPRGKKISVKAHTRVVKPRVQNPTGGATAPSGASPTGILDALVRARFGGAEQGLNQQLASNARFTSGVPAWYAQAINEIKGIGAQGLAQSQASVAQAQNYSSPVAVTGTPDAAQAANARNSLNSQYGTMLTRDQQANQDFINRLGAAMQVQQGNTLNQANRDRQGILAQQTQLAGQKGDFRITQQAALNTAAAKQAQQDYTNQIAAKALGIKIDTLNNVTKPLAQSLIKDRRADNRRDIIKMRKDQRNNDRQYKLNVQKFGADEANRRWQQQHPKPSDAKAQADLDFFNKHGYYPSTGPPKNTKNTPFKPTAGAIKTATAIQDATTRYRNGVSHGQSLQNIANEGRNHGVSESILEIASYLATHNNKPNASVLRKMKALGVDRRQLGI